MSRLRLSLWRHLLKLFKLIFYYHKSLFINVPVSLFNRRRLNFKKLLSKGETPLQILTKYNVGLSTNYAINYFKKLKKHNFKWYRGIFDINRKAAPARKLVSRKSLRKAIADNSKDAFLAYARKLVKGAFSKSSRKSRVIPRKSLSLFRNKLMLTPAIKRR